MVRYPRLVLWKTIEIESRERTGGPFKARSLHQMFEAVELDLQVAILRCGPIVQSELSPVALRGRQTHASSDSLEMLRHFSQEQDEDPVGSWESHMVNACFAPSHVF